MSKRNQHVVPREDGWAVRELEHNVIRKSLTASKTLWIAPGRSRRIRSPS